MLAASWGIPAYFLFSGFRYFSEGLAYTRPAMLVALGMLIVNIPADYVFMYGAFGFYPNSELKVRDTPHHLSNGPVELLC